MRSQIVFVMHPADEAEFVKLVIAEAGVVFIDGPKWPTPKPPTARDVEGASSYLMIWNPNQTPALQARHHQQDGTQWWYCHSEFLTIQFLRSGFQYGEPFLFEGRIAIATTDKSKNYFDEDSAPLIEKRFTNLRRWIRKSYTNKKILWQNISLPRSRTNPLKPAADLWVGPHALNWLDEEPNNRWVQQARTSNVRGYRLEIAQLNP